MGTRQKSSLRWLNGAYLKYTSRPISLEARSRLPSPRPSIIAYRRTFVVSTAMASPTIKLNSGYEMPKVGFGLWKVDNATCADTVYNAIKAGYRLFDGACGMYLFPASQSASEVAGLLVCTEWLHS